MVASLEDNPPADASIGLLAEDIIVDRRKRAVGNVQVRVETKTFEQPLDEELVHERIEIERVAIGREVSEMPAVREEGDTTVIPVVEEVLVIEKRLILKEEIRLRHVRTTTRHRETVTLRQQIAVIERTEAKEREEETSRDLSSFPSQPNITE